MVPTFLSAAQCRQFQGKIWQSNWYALEHHHAWTTSFIKYPLGQYPITLAKWVPRNVYCIFSLWGKIYRPTKHSPTVPAKILIENCCRCPEWIVLCVFVSLQMYQLWKFIMLLFVKSPVHHWRVPHCQRNNQKNSWQGWKSRGQELVPTANDMGTGTVHTETATAMHAACLAACIQQMLVQRFSSKQLSIPYSTPTLCALLCLLWGLPQKDEQFWSPWCNHQLCKICVSSEDYTEDTSLHTTCGTIITDSAEN